MVRSPDRICKVDYDNIIDFVLIAFSLFNIIDLTPSNKYFILAIILYSHTIQVITEDPHIAHKI